MVANTGDSSLPRPHQASSTEDDALKRNTDCVYFLASPLTCKKGSECEYRHSKYARVNPRDCWYWLNGSCLNLKCPFRHPPLDGLPGTQLATSAEASLPISHISAAPVAHATHGKQAVPCIFYQKGNCLKGDKCAFLHGPNPVNERVPQPPAATAVRQPTAVTQLLTVNKMFAGLKKCNQEQKLPQVNVLKSVEVPPRSKPAVKADNTKPRFEFGSVPATLSDDSWTPKNVVSGSNGNILTRSNRAQQANGSDYQSFQTGLDADDYHRESSPGFDVLVDDDGRQSDYYHDDEQYGRIVHEGGKSLNEFDISRPYYDSAASVDGEMVSGPRGYDAYEEMEVQYAWEQPRESSERMLRGSSSSERREGGHRSEGHERINESDLRHHLSKQRKGKGRSAISNDFDRDDFNGGRSNCDSYRDSRNILPPESSLRSRLRDRINVPRRSQLVGNDFPFKREVDRGRNFERLSPGRSEYSSHQGRHRDRMKGRLPENFSNPERNYRGQRIRRGTSDDCGANFTGPKSLVELKEKEPFSLGKRKNLDQEGHQQSVVDVSFEGPKPLSEILKRKRRGETSSPRSRGASACYTVERSQNEQKENSTIEADVHTYSNSEEVKSATKGDTVKSMQHGLVPKEKKESADNQSSQLPNCNEIENDEGMIVEEGLEDHENEGYDDEYAEEDGEDCAYEQEDGGNYNLGEGENGYSDEEYQDEENDNDIAKKIGVIFS